MKKHKLEFIFYWGAVFELSIAPAGYFDPRPRVRIALGFFMWVINLPFWISKKYTDECDPPKYGISIHSNAFWVYYGGKGNYGGNKFKSFYFPWTFQHHKTGYFLASGEWVHDLGFEEVKSENLFSATYPYKYTLKSGEIQEVTATLSISSMEWRRRWLKWCPWFAKKRVYLDVRFSKELGEEAGSWKGGVTGCSETIRAGETPLATLRRMEKNRKFD